MEKERGREIQKDIDRDRQTKREREKETREIRGKNYVWREDAWNRQDTLERQSK